MRVRLTMTGDDFLGTKVFNADTGEDISDRIRSVTIVHRAGEIPTVSIEWLGADVDAVVAEPQPPVPGCPVVGSTTDPLGAHTTT